MMVFLINQLGLPQCSVLKISVEDVPMDDRASQRICWFHDWVVYPYIIYYTSIHLSICLFVYLLINLALYRFLCLSQSTCLGHMYT